MEKGVWKYINIGSQVLLGLIFIISAILKTVYFQLFIESLQSFNFISHNILFYIATGIILLELIVGFFISSGRYAKYAVITSIILLSLFNIIGVYSILLEKNWICACFGPFLSGSFSFSTILRNTFILILALYVYSFRSKEYTFNILSNSNTVILLLSLVSLSIILSVPLIQKKVQKEHIKIGNIIKNMKIQSIDSKIIDTSERKRTLLLFIIFDAEKDCASCLIEFSLWKKIYEDYNSVIEVIGIASARSEDFLRAWTNARKIKFPIIFDERKELFAEYKISTPLKILVNSFNEIVSIQKSTDNLELQNAFLDEIENFLKEKRDDPIQKLKN
ncbi:MAG: redoxin domain-containing protein [Bacteroidota bacterium]|nr:redoxin domain-containing protein [Bacteroidota bacterium]